MKKILSLVLVVSLLLAFTTILLATDKSYTVSGKITTENPGVGATVSLLEGGETKYSVTLDAADGTGTVTQTFALTGVAAGTYDLVVTKASHLSYTVTGVIVENADVDLTASEEPLIAEMKLHAGDINGDTCIDIKDMALLTSDNTYNLSFDQAETKAADVNGDSVFDVKDLMIVTSDYNYSKAPVEVVYVKPTERFVYERVVLLGVDGCGAFFRNASTPNMDAIFADGAVTYRMKAEDPSISAQCWGAMLHGVTSKVHGVTNDIAASYRFSPKSPYPSIFRVVDEAYPDVALAAFSTWDPINYGLIEEGLGVYKATAGNDSLLTDKILNYLDENDPKLLFVQFDNCDGAGHSSGYGSEKHFDQLTTTDGYIGQIYDKLEELGRIENTLFIVTGDHGGTPQGGHGGATAAEMNVIFAAAGKSIKPGGEPESRSEGGSLGNMQIRDVASVVLYAFGLEQPKTWTGTVPADLFVGEDGWKRPIPEKVYYYPHRTHENEPTPSSGSGEYITDFINESRIISYLTFDGNTRDQMGKSTTSGGTKSFTEGFFGRAIELSGGYVELTGVKPGKNSFSVSMWVKTSGVSSDPCLISNKNWHNGSNPGFVLSLRETDIKFNAGNGSSRMDNEFPLPSDYEDGWMHVVMVVDRTENTISLSYDFGTLRTFSIPSNLQSSSFDGISGLVIGQDGTLGYEPLYATIDEVVVFNGAITQSDVDSLAKYYGVK